MSCFSTPEISFARRPDDFHHHLRDEDCLKMTLDHISRVFKRCIVMPNLVPPITTTERAMEYYRRINEVLKDLGRTNFEPLMTLYMTDDTTAEEIRQAKQTGKIFAVKLYPAGATTNSDSGVTDMSRIYPALEAMCEENMPLLVHGEVTDSIVDVFDREAAFIEVVLDPIIKRFPNLKVVLEHITTKEAVQYVLNGSDMLAATITPQHLHYNRNAIFQGGLHPHLYCLPILKREIHRQALLQAVTSGSPKFFLGTDSAPHVKSKKENSCGCAGIYSAHAALELYAEIFDKVGKIELLEAFACENGARFYNIDLNPEEAGRIKLKRESWKVPETYSFGKGNLVVPLRGGEIVEWRCEIA